MGLPEYVISYQCRHCLTTYSVVWDPKKPGHAEPATACPSCGSSVRRYLGTERASGGVTRIADPAPPLRGHDPSSTVPPIAGKGPA